MTRLVRSRPENVLLGVPNNWTKTRIKYGAQINEQKLDDDTPDDYEFSYVEISTVSSDGTVGKPSLHRFADAPSRARRIVRSGDTIISTVRTYLRAVALFEEIQDDLICSTGFAVLSPCGHVEPRFLYYWVRSSPFVDAVVAHSNGVSYPAVNPSNIGDLPLALPPVDRQRAIVDFLDQETERIDHLLEKKRRLIELLEEKRTALISHAVTKGLDPNVAMKASGIPWLGNIPAHWDVAPMKYYTRCLDARRIPLNAKERQRDPGPGPYPYYGANSIVDWINDYLFDETLVLLGEDGAPFFDPKKPVAWVVEGKCWVNNHAHVLRPQNIEPRYLAESLNIADYSHFIFGSTRDKLNQDMMKRIPIPVPAEREQHRIARFIGDKAAVIDTAVEKITQQLERLDEYRQALVTAAVTGQIDVTAEGSEPEEVIA